jgi:hypothetical protein
MTPSLEEREQLACRAIVSAAEWRQKSNARSELTSLSSAVKSLLGVSVERFADSVTGVQFLAGYEIGPALDRMADLNRQLSDALHKEGKPTAGAVDNQITPVHVAWLLGRWECSRSLLAPCMDEVVRRYFPMTVFWAEYCRAMDCLAAGTPYAPNVPTVRGYEQYWVPYLKLVADLTNGRSIVGSQDEIAKSFAKRNRDKRLTDWEMIDGDGKHPVRWDYREASILNFAKHR